MGKTLIINGADFSAIKVGTVEVPRVYQQKTLDWITASGNSSMTDAQKEALDDLVIALYNPEDGFANKIDRLWLPMIAADKAHSLKEYINEVDSYEDMSTSSKELFDNNILFGNNGIYNNAASIVNTPLTIDSSVEIDLEDFSLLYINSMPFSSVEAATVRGGIGILTATAQSAAGGLIFCFTKQTATVNNLKFPADSITTTDNTNPNSCKLRGGISDQGTCKHFLNGSLITKEYTFNQGTLTGIDIMSNTPVSTNIDSTPIGAYILAKALTESQLNVLKNKVEGLLSAMKTVE